MPPTGRNHPKSGEKSVSTDASRTWKARSAPRLRELRSSLPLKLSMKQLSVGLPGRMASRRTPCSCAHRSSALLVNSGPLSTDDLRALPLEAQCVQPPGDTFPGDGTIRLQARAASVPQIHHGENSHVPPVSQAVAHEIHGPVLVCSSRTRPNEKEEARSFSTPPLTQ